MNVSVLILNFHPHNLQLFQSFNALFNLAQKCILLERRKVSKTYRTQPSPSVCEIIFRALSLPLSLSSSPYLSLLRKALEK